MGGTVRHPGAAVRSLWTTPVRHLWTIPDRSPGHSGSWQGRETPVVLVVQYGRDAQRTRTRTRVVARHGRGGHAVVVGCPHRHDGHGLRPAPGTAPHGGGR